MQLLEIAIGKGHSLIEDTVEGRNWRGRFRFNGTPASPGEEVRKVERRHSDMSAFTRPMAIIRVEQEVLAMPDGP